MYYCRGAVGNQTSFGQDYMLPFHMDPYSTTNGPDDNPDDTHTN